MVAPVIKVEIGNPVDGVELGGGDVGLMVGNHRVITFTYFESFMVEVIFGLKQRGVDGHVPPVNGHGAVAERNDEGLT